MSEKATIQLSRKFNVVAMLRKIDILVDDKKIGNIPNGKTEIFELEPGIHKIRVKLWSNSETIDINLLPGSTTILECGISPKFWTRNLLGVGIILAIWFFFTHIDPHLLSQLLILPLAMLAVIGIWITILNFKAGGTYFLKLVGSDEA